MCAAGKLNQSGIMKDKGVPSLRERRSRWSGVSKTAQGDWGYRGDADGVAPCCWRQQVQTQTGISFWRRHSRVWSGPVFCPPVFTPQHVASLRSVPSVSTLPVSTSSVQTAQSPWRHVMALHRSTYPASIPTLLFLLPQQRGHSLTLGIGTKYIISKHEGKHLLCQVSDVTLLTTSSSENTLWCH